MVSSGMRQTGTRAKGSLGTIPTKSERLARGVWAELSGTAEKRYGADWLMAV